MITGIYRENGAVSDADFARLALRASTDAITIAKENKLPAFPKGVSVFLSADNPADLVIAAIGAGTGKHGKPNVVAVAQSQGINVNKGTMFTFDRTKGFMEPCGATPHTGCKALFGQYGWTDISGKVAAAYNGMGSPNPPSPPPSPASSRPPSRVRSPRLFRG